MSVREFYRQFMGPDDLVFDVGANVGERTAVFSSLAKRVIALEPVDGSFWSLSQRGGLPNVIAIKAAAGPQNGHDVIATSSQVPTYGAASMSPLWVEAVTRTHRFGDKNWWNAFQNVEVLTLDSLIKEYGVPAFIKIDVEGFELEVLKGLSTAPRALSFEFTPERFGEAEACVVRCERLGLTEFAWSSMETFSLTNWLGMWGILEILRTHLGDHVLYGDVYARRPA